MTTTMTAAKKHINVANIYGVNYMSKMKSLINKASLYEIDTLQESVMDIVDHYNDIAHPEETGTKKEEQWKSIAIACNNETAVNYIDHTFMRYFGYHFWDILNISWGSRPGETHGSASPFVESMKLFWDLGLVHQERAQSCTDIKHAIDKSEVYSVFESLK